MASMRSLCGIHCSLFLSLYVLLGSLSAGSRIFTSSVVDWPSPSFIQRGKKGESQGLTIHLRQVAREVLPKILQGTIHWQKEDHKKRRTQLCFTTNDTSGRSRGAGTCTYTSNLQCIGTSLPSLSCAASFRFPPRGKSNSVSAVFGASPSSPSCNSLPASNCRESSGPSAAEPSTMAAQESSTPPPKVLFIIGPTGVGKSRLALDICLKLREEGINAEIVSADSMQVYKGCDIATAKATAAERQAVPHHLLDVCTPQEAFSAADYLKAAKQTIQTLSEEGKLPVVVGGTQLYIQLLLWQSAVDLSLQKQNTNQTNANKIREALEAKTNEELVEILRQIDIKRAQQLHPHDRRRIIRSIELTQEFGVPHSEVMKGENKDNLRYDACIFWLDLRDREALEKRLRQRLEKMCQEGLLDEVRWVAEQLQLRSWPPETTGGPRGPIEWPDSPSEGATLGEGRHPSPTWSDSCNPEAHETKKREGLRGGVLQGIGYKEFFPLVLPGANRGAVSDASPSGHSSELFSESLKACLELVVLRSLQYARQQRKWIRNKFLIRRKNVPLYFFETTDASVAEWKEKICLPTLKIVKDFLAGKSFSEDLEFAAAKQMPEVLKLRENTSENDEDAHHGRGWTVCERCQRRFCGYLALKQHLSAPKRCKRPRVPSGNQS